MFYPALRGVAQAGMDFLLSLTVGLLAFLLVDALLKRSSWQRRLLPSSRGSPWSCWPPLRASCCLWQSPAVEEHRLGRSQRLLRLESDPQS